MNLSVSGIVRTSLVAVAGIGLVIGAMHSQGAFAVGSTADHDVASSSATSPVRGSSLLCPGPELKGVQGVDDVDVGVRVAAAAAPLRALTGAAPATAPGKVALSTMPKGPLAPPVAKRATTVVADQAKAAGVLVSATESMAAGLAAAQGWLVSSGDQRSLGGVSCAQPGAEFWIMAGGGAPGRQERLILTNPGGNAVTVDVTLHGEKGAVSSPGGKGIVVPAHGRTAFLLDSISGDLASPVVHLVANGGVVGAVVNDLWLDGARAGGSDDAVPTAPPSRDQVIPAVAVAGQSVLRVAVPGGDEAVVQARVLTTQGPRALPAGGVIRVDGGTVRDIDISALPAGTVGLQVRADVPIVAAAVVTRSMPGQPSDFAWSSSTPPITGVAGMPLVDPAGTIHPGQALPVAHGFGRHCGRRGGDGGRQGRGDVDPPRDRRRCDLEHHDHRGDLGLGAPGVGAWPGEGRGDLRRRGPQGPADLDHPAAGHRVAHDDRRAARSHPVGRRAGASAAVVVARVEVARRDVEQRRHLLDDDVLDDGGELALALGPALDRPAVDDDSRRVLAVGGEDPSQWCALALPRGRVGREARPRRRTRPPGSGSPAGSRAGPHCPARGRRTAPAWSPSPARPATRAGHELRARGGPAGPARSARVGEPVEVTRPAYGVPNRRPRRAGIESAT